MRLKTGVGFTPSHEPYRQSAIFTKNILCGLICDFPGFARARPSNPFQPPTRVSIQCRLQTIQTISKSMTRHLQASEDSILYEAAVGTVQGPSHHGTIELCTEPSVNWSMRTGDQYSQPPAAGGNDSRMRTMAGRKQTLVQISTKCVIPARTLQSISPLGLAP